MPCAFAQHGKAVAKFPNANEGFTEVASGILRIAKSLEGTRSSSNPTPIPVVIAEAVVERVPRSSNLHVKSEVSQREKDQFVITGFNYIEKFFENSLDELTRCNPAARLETHFEKVDSGTFYAVVYRNGKKVSECTITKTEMRLGAIGYSKNSTSPRNSLNDMLKVEAVDGLLVFRPLMAGFKAHSRTADELGLEGAAHYYLNILMEPFQR